MEKVKTKGICPSDILTVWSYWTEEKHIPNWSFADDSWCCPSATNDLRVGKQFCTRMEARDHSFGFDLIGTYTKITPFEYIEYVLEDGRVVQTSFQPTEDGVVVETIFDSEDENPVEMQRMGWQMIMDRFTEYVKKNV